MANSTKRPPKRGKLKQMPSQNGGGTAAAVAEPPEPPPTPFDQEPPPEPPAAAAPAQPNSAPRHRRMEFFDRVNSIPAEDWGTRIFLYLYCFEPICDEKIAGEKKYVNRYNRPVADENEIMVDYGSGKYRLVLSTKKPAGAYGPPIESFDFEIYNIKYPPKIPREAWKNDARNKKWEALLPKEDPNKAGPAAPIDTLAAFDTYMNIQDRIEERMKPATPPAALATTPVAQVDPWSAAERILNMRSENPMVAILQQQQKDSAAALEAERERNFKAAEAAREREFRLQEKLLDQQSKQQTRGIAETLLELVPVLDKLEPLKKVFGWFNGNGTGDGAEKVIRTRRLDGMDLAADLLPKIFESPLANAIAQRVSQPQQPAHLNGTAAQPQQQAGDPFQQFIANVATPAMLEHFANGATGAEFAEWIDWGPHPEYLPRLQQFKHPAIPHLVGAPAIIQAYKNTKEVWDIVGAREVEFTKFINDFCQWTADAEAAVPPVDEDGWSKPEVLSGDSEREERPV